MVEMKRLVAFVLILTVLMNISTHVSAQDGTRVFSVDDVIAGDGKALVFAGYQVLTDCESQQGCWKAGKLSWYLYENGSFRRLGFGDYTPLFWWDGWVLAKIRPYHIYLIRLKNWHPQPLFNMSIRMWNMYFNGDEIVVAKESYYNSTTLYFFNGTLPMRSIKVDGEIVSARYGSGAWLFHYVKRVRRYPAEFREGLYVLRDGRVFRFSTSDSIEDYSFNGTHVLVEVGGYVNKTPWHALYLWNLTASRFLMNMTSRYLGLSIYGWNGTWYLGDRYSLNSYLYRLEDNNLTPVTSSYVYVKGYRNTPPRLVVGSRIILLKGLSETRVRVDPYLDSMDYWDYLEGAASFDDAVAYIKYNDKERKLVVVKDGMKRSFPLGEYFDALGIVPAGDGFFLYSYWNRGSSKFYRYSKGRLEDLTGALESISAPLKMQEFRIESVFPWKKGMFLTIKPPWEGRLLYYYNPGNRNFALIGLNFKPLGGIDGFYVLNSQSGLSYLYNGSCLWRAGDLEGEYAGGLLIAINGSATEVYSVNENGIRKLLRLEVPLKFLYRTGRYPVFRQEGADILAVFNGTSFSRIPVEGQILGLPGGGVAICRHEGNRTELYLWDFRNLRKIGEFGKILSLAGYKNGVFLGEKTERGAFKALYIYNGSLRLLFPPENGSLYYYLNGTVLKQSCAFLRCTYTVFDITGKRIGSFKGRNRFGYSFWRGKLYLTNGTHLILPGKSGTIKLPFEIEDVSLVAYGDRLIIFGGDKLLLYNGTFSDISGMLLRAYHENPYYPSTSLKLCKKPPFEKPAAKRAEPQPSSPSTSSSAAASGGVPPEPICVLLVLLLLAVLYKMRKGE